MAIDIRATVTCSLGTLISASISDDYLQGTGLIKTKGSCELSGVYTPAIGTAVTFSYTQNGVTTQVPRKLRVLSSFADPFRRTTKVELGCKLTYLQDLQEPIKWDAFNDPDNAGLTAADAKIITIPIRAKSAMNKCLTELGITASSNPLTNKFSVAEFDFSAGYVNVLSDLLVSEGYCGYLNPSEVLQVFSLDQAGGSGSVVTSADVIDISGIGVGQLPAEAVTVSYSTLKLKNSQTAGNSPNTPDWATTFASNVHTVVVSYSTQSGPGIRQYNILDSTVESTNYQEITKPDKQVISVPVSRLTTEKTGSAAVLGGLVTEYLSNGLGYNSVEIIKTTQEWFTYDKYGNELEYVRDVTGSAAYLIGSANVPFVLSSTDYVTVNTATTRSLEYIIRRTTTVGDFQKVVIETYGPWARTINGQQTIAAARDNFTTAGQVTSYLSALFPEGGGLGNRGLFLIDTQVSTQTRTEGQRSPTASDQINAANADPNANPANSWRTDSTAQLELAMGSATAQRRIELSMPYAPDDTFTKVGASYSSSPSDAAEKAHRFGRVQNRLLHGNRNGVNLQLAPSKVGSAPFTPFVLQANGLSALYRTNGTNWQLSADGILMSTDALFWGAVGGTGTFWFPVAPGITSLPSEPAIVSGQMTVPAVVPVWNETVLVNGRVRAGLQVQSLPYALSLLTSAAPTVRSRISARSAVGINVPNANVSIAAVAPSISIGAAVVVPSAGTALAAVAPTVAFGATVTVPLAAATIAALAPTVTSGQLSISVPPAGMTMAAVAPSAVVGDPSFSSVQLLLHMDGSNGSTTFTDSSNAIRTVTAGGNTVISTTQSKFGGASAYFDGTTDELSISPTISISSGQDFTIEMWIYTGTLNTGSLISTTTNTPLIRADASFARFYSGAFGDYSTQNSYKANQWQHVAIARSSNNIYMYVDGVYEINGIATGGYTIDRIGYNGTHDFEGYIDDVRVTVGVARYTGTSSFTPPTAAFQNY